MMESGQNGVKKGEGKGSKKQSPAAEECSVGRDGFSGAQAQFVGQCPSLEAYFARCFIFFKKKFKNQLRKKAKIRANPS